MINKATGLSKGYGFVSFSTKAEAAAAIVALDGFRVSVVKSIYY
jgi:RNA recognition motif-containing protein